MTKKQIFKMADFLKTAPGSDHSVWLSLNESLSYSLPIYTIQEFSVGPQTFLKNLFYIHRYRPETT